MEKGKVRSGPPERRAGVNTPELASRIKAAAYVTGDFILRSGGKRSRYYIDKYLFEGDPAILAELGRRFAEKAGDADIIAGAELGGVALAATASMASGKPFVIIRQAKKNHGTAKLIEGVFNVEELRGKRVLLVEDITTTGGQVIEAAKVLTEAGATVTRIVAVLDRMEGVGENATKAGYTFESMLTILDIGIQPEPRTAG